jgi:hypothetical protein
MRAFALAALALAGGGCHDFDHFRTAPDGFAGDMLGAPSDLAGCPTPGDAPGGGANCDVYTFAAGIPAALATVLATGDVVVEPACGMLHVRLPAGASHDLWIDDVGAFRLEEKAPRTGNFTLSARVHGALAQDQQFSGVYATDGSNRFLSVQTSFESTGLHDHDVVFTYPSPSAEQAAYPTATPAAGDSYAYQLERMGDGTQFRLVGADAQTLTISAPAALTPGVVVGNCCNSGAPAFDAYVEWMMVCQ